MKDKTGAAEISESDRSRGQGAKRAARTNFKRLDDVLGKVVGKLGLDRRLQEHTLINLWPVIVGDPWAKRSRGLFLDAEGNLVVAVSDASTGQELSMMKTGLIAKLRGAGRSIGVNVGGIRFDLKHYHGATQPELESPGAGLRALPEPTETDIQSVDLPDDDRARIGELKESLSSSDTGCGVAPERILHVFERDLRIKRWQRANGYPSCSRCDMPAAVLHGDDLVCPPCFFAKQ